MKLHPDECPKCKTSWLEDKTIFEYFLSKGNSVEEAVRIAENYGCTTDSPKHFSKDVIGVQIQGEYDGVSIWKCKKCNFEFNRFTLEEIN